MESKTDTPPDDRPIEQCHNCSFSPITEEAKFCPSCGQDCKEKRITVWSLFKEAFANFFNLDNKLWQTILLIFIPGRLTKEFFAGRRQRYVSPLRVFLITALGFFAVIQMFSGSDASELIDKVSENHKKSSFYGVFLEKMELESDTLLQDSLIDQISHAPLVLDSIYQRMHRSYSDSTTIGVVNLFSRKDSLAGLTVARKDLVQLSQDSLLKRYGNGNFWDDLILQQNLKLAQNGENFFSYLLGQLVWMMLLMMPFLAIFLKLLYIRRNFYYVDHLIFSFHTHAFVFVMLSVLLLINKYFPTQSAIISINAIGALGMFAYLFMAMLKVYQQSKTKTFVKLLLMNFFYILLFAIAISLTSVVAALNY